jgi:NAD(P)-dependent dehydrogenase (short-subunit alcohol dehydrogenase family)
MSAALTGKAVVVTGGAQGLGLAFAEAILAEGGSVVVNDVEAETLDGAMAGLADVAGDGARVLGHVSDIATWEGARALIDACVQRFGRIDGLVNNAGVFYNRLPWEDTEEDLRNIVEINLLGTMYCGVHALRAMRRQGDGGAIVNISSEAHFGYPTMDAYGATKGGVASLTYGWARNVAELGVRVNAVAPNAQTRLSPIGPDGKPLLRPPADSVAPVVTYLLSDASAAVTGQMLQFNGTSLSPVLKPRLLDEPLVRERWTLDDIAAACAGPLAEHLA